jgi:hypothetical protein
MVYMSYFQNLKIFKGESMKLKSTIHSNRIQVLIAIAIAFMLQTHLLGQNADSANSLEDPPEEIKTTDSKGQNLKDNLGNKISFQDISLAVQKHSFTIAALEKESSSAELSRDRTAKHWHPKLYLEGRAYTTNDPALNFFSKLGQRDARQSDFSTKSARTQISNFLDTSNQPYTTLNSQTLNLFAPDTLNYPGSNSYQKGTLGVDLPLYEGGAKANIAGSYDHVSKGKNLEKKSVILSEYSTTAGLYAQLVFLEDYKKSIKNLQTQVQSILNNYQVGARSNPVGYSGLLGLKSLKNRLEGLSLEVNTRETSIHEYLSVVAQDIGKDWNVIQEPLPDFLNQHLPRPNVKEKPSVEGVSLSYQALAMKEYAEGAARSAEVEKSKFLPRAGVFGESNLYSGSRNTASAYNVGFYVQMNLYNAEDIGTYDEAKLKADAAKEKVLDQIRKEGIRKEELLNMEVTLNKQLQLLKESSTLMEDQVSNSKRMFANGSINAMQLSEILSRTADLVVQNGNANREYILVRSELYTLFSNQ